MPDTLLVLGQAYPTATALTTLYTAPARTTVSSITACNQSSTIPANIRISVAIAGAADTAAQYIIYDTVLQSNEARAFVIGITLANTDVIRVQSSTGTVSFQAFGVQVT